MSLNNNLNIAIYHEPEYIDTRFITVCDDVRLFREDTCNVEEIVKVWTSLVHKPKLIVFDLDLTLWPFWIDSHVTPPFYKSSTDFDDQYIIIDEEKRKMTFFSDVPLILNTLSDYCLKTDGYMAAACSTEIGDATDQLLKLFEWNCYFNSMQFSKLNRCEQIGNICNELGVNDMNEVLLFQQNEQHFNEIKRLGVSVYLVDMKNGITCNDCIKGLKMHDMKFS